MGKAKSKNNQKKEMKKNNQVKEVKKNEKVIEKKNEQVTKTANVKKNKNKTVKKNEAEEKEKMKEQETKKEEVKTEEAEEDSGDESEDFEIDAFISEQNIEGEEKDEKDKEEKEEENEKEAETEENTNDEELPLVQEEEEEEEKERPAINNTVALTKRYNDIRLDTSEVKLPWIEVPVIISKNELNINDETVHDDIKRELAFYEQALEAAKMGNKKYKELGKPFTRPNDYFAEMIKTDEHMEKVRQNMIEESESIKNAEAAKKQRDLRKYGKKVQTEKLLQKNKMKKMELEKIKNLKRKRSNDDGDFDISLDFDNETTVNNNRKMKKGEKPQKSKKRLAKDKKFGFSGRKRGLKQNTAESTNDMSGFNYKKMKQSSFSGGNKKQKRLGKNRRKAMNNRQ